MNILVSPTSLWYKAVRRCFRVGGQTHCLLGNSVNIASSKKEGNSSPLHENGRSIITEIEGDTQKDVHGKGREGERGKHVEDEEGRQPETLIGANVGRQRWG